MTDEDFMALALEQARAAISQGEVPVGAVLAVDGEVVAAAHNLRESLNDPCAHAELLVIRETSCVLKRWRLSNATLYVTLEPCIMCMGAALLARIDRIVFGALDPKGGAAGSLYDLSSDPRLNHRIVLHGGIAADESSQLLREFFRALRQRRLSARRDGTD